LYAKRCRQRESGQAVRAIGEVHALSLEHRFRLAAGSRRELRHGDAFRRRGLVLVAEACRIFWLPARLLVARAAARYPGADEQAGCDARLVEDTERVAVACDWVPELGERGRGALLPEPGDLVVRVVQALLDEHHRRVRRGAALACSMRSGHAP